MNENFITESELVLPSLYLMLLNGGRIDTSELIKLLTSLMKPVGQDVEILENRKDTHFSQKVRNLKSHKTLLKNGFATHSQDGFIITQTGEEFVKKNQVAIRYLFDSSFEYDDIRFSLGKIFKAKRTIIIPYSEIVTEGSRVSTSTKSYQRSKKLRDAAVEHFSHNGIIECDCCGFEFRNFYGDLYGQSCIEIHHLKPIFQYSGMSVQQTVQDALENLIPVCPNCHRVIHKNNITAPLIPSFKREIRRIHRL